MQVITESSHILRVMCYNQKKWGIFFNGTSPDIGANYHQQSAMIKESAPWIKTLNAEDNMNVMCDGSGFLLFDTKDEMEKIYNMTVSDDNRKGDLPLIYMLTCNPDGELLTENT